MWTTWCEGSNSGVSRGICAAGPDAARLAALSTGKTWNDTKTLSSRGDVHEPPSPPDGSGVMWSKQVLDVCLNFDNPGPSSPAHQGFPTQTNLDRGEELLRSLGARFSGPDSTSRTRSSSPSLPLIIRENLVRCRIHHLSASPREDD